MGCFGSKKEPSVTNQDTGNAAKRNKGPQMDLDLRSRLAQETYLSEMEIANLYGVFMTANPNGKMKRDQFTKSYAKVLPDEAQALGDFVFEVTDRNRDGLVDFEEYVRMMSTIYKGSVDEKIQMVFGVYDLDKSGNITRDEMLKVFQALVDGAPPGAKKPVLSPEEKVKYVFREMDTNQDQVISMEEFVRAVKKDPSIIEPLPFIVDPNSPLSPKSSRANSTHSVNSKESHIQ